MDETVSLKDVETASAAVVDRLLDSGFAMKSAFLLRDHDTRWRLYVVPDDVPGAHWHGYSNRVAAEALRAEDEFLGGERLHFAVVHDRYPVVTSVRALRSKDTPLPARVTGYDGRMFIERAVVFRDAA
jgi:hypothetical protein